MRKCAHCHNDIRIWQPYVTSKKNLKEYHTACWDKRKTNDEPLLEVKQLRGNKSDYHSPVPYISINGARSLGYVILMIVVLMGGFFSEVGRIFPKFGTFLGVVLVSIALFIIIKLILNYTSNRINSDEDKNNEKI